MIHGFASGLHTWKKVIPELTDDHRVLALDLKGFGWSDRPEGDYSPAEQARVVLALMDARGIERAAIVGHSYGASVALALALAAPERVTRLVLYDAWVYEAQLPTFFHMARSDGVGEALFAAFYDQRPEDRMALAFHDPTIIEQDFVDHAVEMLARPGTRAAALAAVRAMRYGEIEAQYGTIDKPVLLL
jgi:pimeloyl-ACP methyl ester carboxylesterase